MIEPDHDCAWTRGRRSALHRTAGILGGAGLPRAVIEAAARHLGVTLSATIDPEDEYTELLDIGPWRGTLHDGCFVQLEVDEPDVRAALLAAALELHEAYLGARLQPGALAAATDRLADGAELLLQSIPGRRELRLRAYPMSAGIWRRWTAPVTRIRV
jgi:hypothetical protein